MCKVVFEMIIGIDIDDTLTETSSFANSLVSGDVKDYHELEKDELLKFVHENIENITLNVELRKDALEVLKMWKKRGWKIVFITARGDENVAIFKSLLYFKKYDIPFDKIVFKKHRKALTCKEENVEVFIDDKEIVLNEVKKLGIKTIKMGGESENHEVVKSWIELKDTIERLGENGR